MLNLDRLDTDVLDLLDAVALGRVSPHQLGSIGRRLMQLGRILEDRARGAVVHATPNITVPPSPRTTPATSMLSPTMSEPGSDHPLPTERLAPRGPTEGADTPPDDGPMPPTADSSGGNQGPSDHASPVRLPAPPAHRQQEGTTTRERGELQGVTERTPAPFPFIPSYPWGDTPCDTVHLTTPGVPSHGEADSDTESGVAGGTGEGGETKNVTDRRDAPLPTRRPRVCGVRNSSKNRLSERDLAVLAGLRAEPMTAREIDLRFGVRHSSVSGWRLLAKLPDGSRPSRYTLSDEGRRRLELEESRGRGASL